MNSKQLLAHPDHPLSSHLSGVAELAEKFAGFFGGASQGRLVGLLHDLGKAEKVFQDRMAAIEAGKNDPGGKEPHAHHGAALALAQDHWPVAFAVNGHHAGLHNRSDLAKRAEYENRAQNCVLELEREEFSQLRDSFGPILPKCLETLGDDLLSQMLAVELFTRFLFSALVDADRLDTERSDQESSQMAQDRGMWRNFDATSLSNKLENFITGKQRDLDFLFGRERDVQRVRNEVAELCRKAGNNHRGLFSLTVPTGGGKTLASMLFALNHAKAHSQDDTDKNGITRKSIRRVIVVIPYLSIIQQTASVLKEVFNDTQDDPVILEHHSNASDPALDEKKLRNGKTSDYSRARTLRQLAAENWDAPIIVTTSVQFFNSLFSRSPADARKLHNIAQSVIIFDEVQTLPPICFSRYSMSLGNLLARIGPTAVQRSSAPQHNLRLVKTQKILKNFPAG